jgi:DNA-binding response OmpR family regulator
MAKILVVDDDLDMTEACQLVLEQAGHEIMTANSYQDGMRAVANFQPDLLILDVMMAELDDGIAMAQELRRTGFDRPILVLSSISKATGMEYGVDNAMIPVDDFVEKPISPAALVEKVAKLLGRKEGG